MYPRYMRSTNDKDRWSYGPDSCGSFYRQILLDLIIGIFSTGKQFISLWMVLGAKSLHSSYHEQYWEICHLSLFSSTSECVLVFKSFST